MSDTVRLDEAEWRVLTQWTHDHNCSPVEFAKRVGLPGRATMDALISLAAKGVLNSQCKPVAGKRVMWRP